jgi:hypothetical protein
MVWPKAFKGGIKLITEKTWKEFREAGLLFFINQILHIFGWAICMAVENEEIKRVYPARVKYRGFGEKQIEEGYQQLSKFMADNADDLYKESCD